jgi:hypothetical protein
MNKNIVYLISLVVMINLGCGGDRPLEYRADEQSSTQEPEGGLDAATIPDLNQLLLDGTRYDTPFILGQIHATADLFFMQSGNELEASLREDGFDGPLLTLAIASKMDDGSTNVLLHIRADGIFDGDGNRLVEQIPAKYGYAWRVGTSTSEAAQPRRSYLSLILLDKDRAGASDELYIYWKPAVDAKGSFVVSNIPNEIM